MLNETLKTIHNRVSIKDGFLDKEIPSSTLETIIEAGLRAPTASNLQRYSIIIIRDKERHKRLGIYPCDVAIIFCADINRWIRIFQALKQKYPFSGVKQLLTSIVDAVLCAENVALSAHSLGIGSRFTNVIFRRNSISELRSILNLPRFVFPIISICLGYPKTITKDKRGRAKKGIVHYETYNDFSEKEIEEIIDEYNSSNLKNWVGDYNENQNLTNIEFLVNMIQKRIFDLSSRRELWKSLIDTGFFEAKYNGF